MLWDGLGGQESNRPFFLAAIPFRSKAPNYTQGMLPEKMEAVNAKVGLKIAQFYIPWVSLQHFLPSN